MPLRIRLLNRQMGHERVPVVLRGHSLKPYGTSRFSPADNCHCVEMTHEAYEAARQDLSKAMRLGSRQVWEVAIVKDEGGRMKDEEDGLQKRIAELEALLEERRVAMAEQGDVNLKLREELAKALGGTAPSVLSPSPVPRGTGPLIPSVDGAVGAVPTRAPVSERTPWNALQKIAKVEGVDLKLHKNKASLLKAIEDRRAARVEQAPILPAVTPVGTGSPPGGRVLRLWDEQDPRTLDVVFFAEVVDDPELWASSDGTKGKTTLKSDPMPCRDKQERQKAMDAFYDTLNAEPAAA